MRDAIRILLVDPSARANPGLTRQLEAINEFDLLETCPTYATALKRIATVMPDVAIIVTDHDLDDSVNLVSTLASSLPDVAILPAGEGGNGDVILKVVRAGAREFLPLPTPSLELVETIRGLNPRRIMPTITGPRGPKVIAVTGAAGGVGCTTISVNLASNLAKLSRRDTLIADFDLLLGSLEECLAVSPEKTIESVVRDLDGLDPVALKRLLPRHKNGLYMLPHPLTLEESARLDLDGVREVLSLLKDSFDSIVIDTSKGLQATDFLAFDAADVILVVLQLNVNCTRNTVRLTDYLRSFEGFGEKIRLVANRTNSPQSEISVKKAEELLKGRLQYLVGNSTKLCRPARTLGVPIDEVDGGAGSKVHQDLVALAQELLPFPPEPARTRRKLFASFR
jgi:pilus assembly protein CpaE